MEAVAFALGLFLLALTYWDLFETVVVPRPTPGWFRIGRYLLRGSWRALRAIRDGRPGRSHERLLGLFAPAATIALLAAWLIGLIVGYGLVLYALRDELRPVPLDLGSTLYFAATSVLTLGFGDIVAAGGPARLVITTAAITGYTLAARDIAWPAFKTARAKYALRLEAMAQYWTTPATTWLGDPVALRLPLHPQDDP